MVGHHRFAVAAAGVCLIVPSVAMACVIDSQVCTTPSTGFDAVYLTPSAEDIDPASGSFVMLQSTGSEEVDDDLVFVNCQSGGSIVVAERRYRKLGYWDAAEIMQEAIDTPKIVSVRALRNQLKAAGYDSVVGKIPADHCACDRDRPLPVMGCGDGGP